MDPLVTYKEEYEERETLAHKEARLFAFWAVVLSTASVITAIVTLPALYTSMHNLRSEIGVEADFCRLRVRDFWLEMYVLGRGAEPLLEARREKRSWMFGHWVNSNQDSKSGQYDGGAASSGGYGAYESPSAPMNLYDGAAAPAPMMNPYGGAAPADGYGIQLGKEVGGEGMAGYGGGSPPASSPHDVYPAQAIYAPAQPPSSAPQPASGTAAPPTKVGQQSAPVCPCVCQQSPPGPAGEPGDNGKDGKDGAPGAAGTNGNDGSVMAHGGSFKEPCIICPIGMPGPVGPQGPRGPPGPRGTNGISGIDGRRGEPGMQGPPGPSGLTGTIGTQGPVGVPGRQFLLDAGPRGPTGKTGAAGPKGLAGCQGTPGGIVEGPVGPAGDPGRPGRDGHKGTQGKNGVPGSKGTNGDCAHCPIPRTPPGY